MEGPIFQNMFKVEENPTPALLLASPAPQCLPGPDTQHLLAGVAAVVALESLLIFVSFLVLDQSVAIVEHSRAVTALHLCSFVCVQFAQMDT